ncbi:hypothetical protein Hanom_Chr17g01591321 [Helianthus anomalus]
MQRSMDETGICWDHQRSSVYEVGVFKTLQVFSALCYTCTGHRKGAYDEAPGYIMNIITCLILNRPYNISQVIFNHMLDNIKGERYGQYPRFVQMFIDDQVQNLPKADGDELRLEHMDSETLKRLDVYKEVKNGDEPKFRQKFAAIKKADYEAPEDDKWRHDNSNSDDETKKMELLLLKKTRWWVKKDEKPRKRTLKVTTPKVVQKDTKKKKSPPRLVDEPLIDPQEVIDRGVDLLNMSFAEYERLSAPQVDKDVAKSTENVESTAGGEALKETLVEGEMHTNLSETESEIEVTQIAPISYVSGKFKLKKTVKKKKASDEEDATYEPTSSEKEKLKKKSIRKRKARPTGEVPKRHKVRKRFLFKIASHPPSPVQQSVPIPKEVREKTPEKPPKTVEEPISATKKPPTQQTSSHGFPKIPSDLGSGLTGLEDFGDWFNDGKLNALTRKVSLLEKAKAESEAKFKATKERLKDVEAENVALRNEVEELTNEISLTSANEILKKDVEDLRADKAIKDEQIKMLYAVLENLIGINLHAACDEIEIQRAEAQRMEKEKRDAKEATEALKDKRKGIVVDTEEILGSSSLQELPQPDAEVNVSHVEVNVDDVEMKDAEVEVNTTNIEVNLAIVTTLLYCGW